MDDIINKKFNDWLSVTAQEIDEEIFENQKLLENSSNKRKRSMITKEAEICDINYSTTLKDKKKSSNKRWLRFLKK